jgi:hypothetical protein
MDEVQNLAILSRSSRLRRRVDSYVDPNVSEKHAVSIFKTKVTTQKQLRYLSQYINYDNYNGFEFCSSSLQTVTRRRKFTNGSIRWHPTRSRKNGGSKTQSINV